MAGSKKEKLDGGPVEDRIPVKSKVEQGMNKVKPVEEKLSQKDFLRNSIINFEKVINEKKAEINNLTGAISFAKLSLARLESEDE